MLKIHYKETPQPTPNQPWLPSVHGVVMDSAKNILLHKREDHPLWALPGGKIKPGESIVACLQREVREETGLDISPEKLLGIFSSPEYLLSVKNKVFQPLLIVFLCHVKYGRPRTNTESLAFAWMNKENVETLETFPLVKEIANWTWDKKSTTFFDSSNFKK